MKTRTRNFFLEFVAVAFVACTDSSQKPNQEETSTDSSVFGNGGETQGGALCKDEVSADDYDRTCDVNDDCVAVFEGPVADACRCVNAGIAADAFEDYEADLGPESCYDPGNCWADCTGAVGDRGACDQGQCVSGAPFLCGDATCNGLNETCVRFGSDVDGEPDGFSCVLLPTAQHVSHVPIQRHASALLELSGH